MTNTRSKYISHQETPQSERGYTELKKPARSPNSPYLYSPYLSPPLATSTKKESKAEAERKDPAAR
jgi:hypothetical protein